MHKFNRSVGRQLGVSGREDDRQFWISLPNFQSKFESIHPRHGVICHQIRPPATATLLQREQDPKSPFVFTSERGSPFTTAGFARMVERAGVEAKLGFPAHPHMLRHAQQGPRHPGRCRLTSATATSSTRCDVRSDLYDQMQLPCSSHI